MTPMPPQLGRGHQWTRDPFIYTFTLTRKKGQLVKKSIKIKQMDPAVPPTDQLAPFFSIHKKYIVEFSFIDRFHLTWKCKEFFRLRNPIKCLICELERSKRIFLSHQGKLRCSKKSETWTKLKNFFSKDYFRLNKRRKTAKYEGESMAA